MVPGPNSIPVTDDAPPPTLGQFFELDWVKDPHARPEVLLLRRDGAGAGPSDAVPRHASAFMNGVTGDATSKDSGNAGAPVAFPGGRAEEGDEGCDYTGIFVSRTTLA